MDSLVLGTIKFRGKKLTAIKMGKCYLIFQNKTQKNSSRENTRDILRTFRVDSRKSDRSYIPLR